MSEFRDVLQHIVSDREPGTVELCRNLKTGAAFTAEVEEIQDTELNTELGRDAREGVLMHVSDREVAAAILAQQSVAIFLYGEWVTFKVLRRKNNPANPQVEFGLMKLTEKDS
jgi:predicted trehalose synthase